MNRRTNAGRYGSTRFDVHPTHGVLHQRHAPLSGTPPYTARGSPTRGPRQHPPKPGDQQAHDENDDRQQDDADNPPQ